LGHYVGLYSPQSEIDLLENTIRIQLFENYARTEHGEPATFDEVPTTLDNLRGDNTIVSVLGEIISIHIGPGYTFDTPIFVCDRSVEVTSEQRNDCNCSITTRISRDLSVPSNDIVVDEYSAANIITHILRAVFMALTRSPCAETTLYSFEEGTAVHFLSINRRRIDGFFFPILAGVGNIIENVISTVPAITETVEEVLDSVLDPEGTVPLTLSLLNLITQEKAEIVASVGSAREEVELSFLAIEQAEDIATITRTAVMESFENTENVVELAEMISQNIIDNRNAEIERLRTAYQHYQNTVHYSDLNTATCKQELYQARLDQLTHQGNLNILGSLVGRISALTGSLAEVLLVKEQFIAILDSLTSRIGILDGDLISLQSIFQNALNILRTGVLRTLSSLHVNIEINLSQIINLITTSLPILRPTINSVVVVFINLGQETDPIEISITIEDVLNEGEIIEDMIHYHSSLLYGILALVTESTEIIIVDIVHTANGYVYRIFVGEVVEVLGGIVGGVLQNAGEDVGGTVGGVLQNAGSIVEDIGEDVDLQDVLKRRYF